MSFYRIKYLILSIIGALIIAVMPVGLLSNQAFAQGTTGSSCAFTSGSNFFAFPTWYEYLPGVTESNGQCQPQLKALKDIWLVVMAVIDILLRLAAIAAVFMVIYGGVLYMTSMGSPETASRARKVIIDSLVGLLIAVMATFMVTYLAGII